MAEYKISESIDLGPVIGGWYFVLTLIVLRSRGWLAEQLASNSPPVIE